MSASLPQLSVILATHNRCALLRRCLDSLAAQTLGPERFEVIVADDGSTDGSAAMVEALRTPYELRLLALEKGGQPAAQNAAIAVARGAVCLLLDDDVIASPTLLEAHLAAHLANPMTIGIGSLTQERVAARDWFAHSLARGWSEHYEELARREARWTDCYGANVSYPRDRLVELGGIATDLEVAYDFEIALRVCSDGCTPRYLPDAHGIHDDQKRSNRMLVDAGRQGRMHVELARRYPDSLPDLLAWDDGAGRLELALRRLAVRIPVPLAPLAAAGRVLPGEGRKMIWLHFVRKVAFWRGVREAAGNGGWASLTAPGGREQLALPVLPLPLILFQLTRLGEVSPL